ncbi:16S rRNA (guanine(966)-N(2))-methyltransferase RsmD [Polaromonas sp. OV174]|uniref:16S rRNA (guanine(966)-N(2))-methyltransferase RsmD n=1 Tax=Polaromonas sp. OV174 TaxID=1855300 RepID=UPI0008EF1DA5|nr:16S rRNA (guanine(966)-N(2))-methyltransferase RsmD [Polaromonas sp. OV174]SFC51617.1 16S rRNA (guanine(966)-N(2))-methyltransferase RsmD [Polaromonas sp. OV174]
MKYTPLTPAVKPPSQASEQAAATRNKARAQAAHARAHAKPPGEIRIIGGLYKRTKLAVPNVPGLRPTPDRVRETLFNWLGQDLTGWRCADVFAGTGVLGFEAVSRGAAEVLLCEQDPALVLQLKALQARLKIDKVKIERGDGLAMLRRLAVGSMQLVFLDPPFESTQFESALKAAAQAIGPTGLVYLEAPKAWTDEELLPLGLQLQRSGKAGAVHFHLLSKGDASPKLADA